MSTLTFSSIGVSSRRTAHKRLPRAATQARSTPTSSLTPLQAPSAPSGKKRGRYELVALVALVAVLHAVIGISILQNQSEPLSVPPKVPPIEIQISKPVPLPQALPPPLPRNVPAPTPPKKAEAPTKPAPAPTTAKVAPAPVVQDAVATNSAPPASNAVTASPAATESPAASSRSTGERVTQARADADYLNNPPPKYPAIAQSRGWEGQVMLNVHVLANGRADIVNIEQSSGRKTLDEAAIKAVTEWRFVPAKRGQTPIDGWVQVPIDFKLGK